MKTDKNCQKNPIKINKLSENKALKWLNNGAE